MPMQRTKETKEAIKAALNSAMDKLEHGNSFYGWRDLCKALRQATGLRAGQFTRLLRVMEGYQREVASDLASDLDALYEDDEEP